MHNNHADTHCSATPINVVGSANADAVLTIAADSAHFWVLDWIAWSYSGAPTGGKLTVSIGGSTKFEIDITASGPGSTTFGGKPLYVETKNQQVVITLTAGGVGVVGKLNARYR